MHDKILDYYICYFFGPLSVSLECIIRIDRTGHFTSNYMLFP